MANLIPGLVFWRDGKPLLAIGVWLVLLCCFFFAFAPFAHPLIGPALVGSLSEWIFFPGSGMPLSMLVTNISVLAVQTCELFVAWLLVAILLWAVRQRVRWASSGFLVRTWCAICCPGLGHVLAGQSQAGLRRFGFFVTCMATVLAPLMIAKATFWSGPLGWMAMSSNSALHVAMLNVVLDYAAVALVVLTVWALADSVWAAFRSLRRPLDGPVVWPADQV